MMFVKGCPLFILALYDPLFAKNARKTRANLINNGTDVRELVNRTPFHRNKGTDVRQHHGTFN